MRRNKAFLNPAIRLALVALVILAYVLWKRADMAAPGRVIPVGAQVSSTRVGDSPLEVLVDGADRGGYLGSSMPISMSIRNVSEKPIWVDTTSLPDSYGGSLEIETDPPFELVAGCSMPPESEWRPLQPGEERKWTVDLSEKLSRMGHYQSPAARAAGRVNVRVGMTVRYSTTKPYRLILGSQPVQIGRYIVVTP